MNISFPLKFNVEFQMPDGTTIVQSQDGRCVQRPPASFSGDWLTTYHKNADFLRDPRFIAAYRKGMDSGHKIMGGGELNIEWRVHGCLWAAQHAAKLDGDFVECGVNTGCYSLAVMEYLNFSELDKQFYLFDTYSGIPVDQVNPEEQALGRQNDNSYYFDCYELAKANFSAYDNAVLVQGKVPDTLSDVEIEKVAYLSIDMNIVAPEIAAGEFFWDKLVPGAIIVLDDYGWIPYKPQKDAWDIFAKEKGVPILNMPTGQGIIIKA